MPNNHLAVLVLAVVYAIAAVGIFALSFNRRHVARSARRFAKSIDLAISHDLAPTVSARVARRHRGAGVGALIGAAITVPLALMQDGAETMSGGSAYLVFGGFFTGLAIGVAVASALHLSHVGEIVRYARPRAVELRHYIAPIERHGARVVVGVAAFMLGVFGTLTSFFDLIPGLGSTFSQESALIVMNVGMNVLLWAMIVMLIFASVSRPQSYFLRQLWPNMGSRELAPPTATEE